MCGAEPRLPPNGYVQKFYHGYNSCVANAKPLYTFLYHAGCLTASVGESSRKWKDLNSRQVIHEQFREPNCKGSAFSVKRYNVNECKEHFIPFSFKYDKQVLSQ